jgi:hypothetical protein
MNILHIGAPKTGTTTLQNFLTSARERLAEKGILVPKAGWKPNGGHVGFRNSLNRSAEDDDESENIKTELTRSFEDKSTVKLICCEMLWTVAPKRVAEVYPALKKDDIKIVLYIRRQDKIIYSHYAQRVKSGRTVATLPEFVEQNFALYDYSKVAADWSTVFGEGCIVARVYEDVLATGGIVPNFLETMVSLINAGPRPIKGDTATIVAGILKGSAKLASRFANRTVSPNVTRLLLLLNRSDFSDPTKDRIREAILNNASLFETPTDEPAISEEDTRAIHEKYAESNTAFRTSYFPRSARPSLFPD